MEVAGAHLSRKIAAAGNPDIYHVIVHVGPEALSTGPAAGDPAAGHGDKLDLDLAIWTCFANARIDQQASQQHEQHLAA